jgi:hypothetical protein
MQVDFIIKARRKSRDLINPAKKKAETPSFGFFIRIARRTLPVMCLGDFGQTYVF